MSLIRMHSDDQLVEALHGQPLLNFDILHLVCNRITTVSDVLSFALTCSALTETAFRRRLCMSPVDLCNGDLVDSFHKFVFADEAARAPYVYGLKLPHALDYYSSEHHPRFRIIDDHLVAILRATIHLEYLSLPTSVNDPVLTTVANLATLHELCIVDSGWGSASSPMWEHLTTFRSPIRSFRVDKDDNHYSTGCFRASRSQMHLGNFAHTLEHLDLEVFYLDIAPSNITRQFTAVRSLKTNSIPDFDDGGLKVLLQLFPNLNDTLVVGTLAAHSFGESFYPILQERSKKIQETQVWSRLDRVVCDTKAAFLLALQCPIRNMDITVVRSREDGPQYDLAPIIRDSCPRKLHVGASFDEGLSGLDGLFPSEGVVDDLTHLVMFAEFTVRRYWDGLEPVPWTQFMEKLIDSTKHLRLTHLRLVFHYDALRQPDPLYTAGEMDLYPLATRFVDTIPTLQYIFLTTSGSDAYPTVPSIRWLSSKAWRVVRDAEGRLPSSTDSLQASECVALTGTEAERVLDKEELHLSRDEEDTVRKCGNSETWEDLSLRK